MTDINTTPEVTTAKKSTKKVAKAKKAAKKAPAKVRSVRGHVYEFTDKGKKLDVKELSAQQAFIVRFIKGHGGRATTAAIAEAAEKDSKGFPCNQPRKRAVAYYMTAYKNDGLLRFAKESKAAAA